MATPMEDEDFIAPRTGTDWQDISTAPKDGGCLVYCKTDSGGEIHVLERDTRGNWIYEEQPTFCHSFYIEPTHWMPIPPPPTEKE